MSALHTARLLAGYTAWANNRILSTAAAPTDKELAWQLHPTLPGVLSILQHMLGSQLFWLARWQDRVHDEGRVPGRQDLWAAYQAMHDDLVRFAEDLRDDDWTRPGGWWKPWGEEETMELGKTFLQVINHGTQHRAEIAVLLSALGHSPSDLDILDYLGSSA